MVGIRGCVLMAIGVVAAGGGCGEEAEPVTREEVVMACQDFTATVGDRFGEFPDGFCFVYCPYVCPQP